MENLSEPALPFMTDSQEDTLIKAEASTRGVVNRLVITITLLLIFIMAARTPLDTDLWWHLRAGAETLRIGQPLLSDPFSFTRLGTPWINHSWLSQVGMALLFDWGGYLVLGGTVAGLATLSMVFVLLQCDGPVFLKSAALLLGSVVASVVWVPRPQLTSLVLMALTGYLLYLYKHRGRDLLWVLPPIFILWSNLHGGYPLGLLLIGSMLAGEVVNHILGLESEHILTWKQIARLGGWTALCLLAVLVNPNGLDMWRIPFQTLNVGVLQQFIPEWASPDFHSLLQQTLLWLFLSVFAAVALSGKTMDCSDLICVLGFATLALVARRNYGPFALVAVPVLVRYGAAALEAWRQRSPWLSKLERRVQSKTIESLSVRRIKKTINLSLAVLLALVAIGKLYVVTQPAFVNHYLVESYPVRAVEWLVENHPRGRMLNEYNSGGYLLWALPETRVFVDGRTDLFGDEIIGEWIGAVQAGPGWQETLERYEVDLVMLSPDQPLLQQLPGAGWNLLYQDAQTKIFGRE